jgi:ABC-type amino acid transport system permease subunit
MIATAILYLLMSYPASRLARQLEVRLGVTE